MVAGEQGMLRERKARGTLGSMMQRFRARLPASTAYKLCDLASYYPPVTQFLQLC